MPAVDRYPLGGRGATQPARTRFKWRSGTRRAAGWPADALGPTQSTPRSRQPGSRFLGLRVLAILTGARAGGPDACAGEVFGDRGQLAVGVLADLGQHGECLVRGDLEPLHQDALGLADDVPVQQGAGDVLEVVGV